MMGKTYMGVERTSFIVGPDGRVEHVLPRVKPADHVDLLVEALAA
jgi:peroxiredoxin Q/BCP